MTSNVLLLMPVLVHLATAILALFAWKHVKVQRILSVTGSTLAFLAAATLLWLVRSESIQATQLGNWPAPFGVTFVADLFSGIMVTITGLMGLIVVIYSLAHIDECREEYGYFPLLHVLLMGVSGAFLTGDLFNLYVWFEIMLMSSFVLLALGGERAQLAGAFKYVSINLLSSAIFLTAIGILYGLAGTLNMADLSRELDNGYDEGLVTTLAMMFLVAFGIKAGLFPLFFWLPDSYHTPPVPVTTIFSALLTKVGVYALVRSFTLLFTQEVDYTHTLLMVIAGLTMVTGVLGAVAQMEFRRLLSFHIISQIGYLLMGLAIYTPLALAGVVFFMIHVILTKSALFLVSGIVNRVYGSYDLKKLGGVYQANLGLAALFAISAFSLAGLPPFSGFWAKLTLIKAGIETEDYVVVAVALGVSVLTLFSMTKIWAEVFWKSAHDDSETTIQSGGFWLASMTPLVLLVGLTLLLGLAAEPILDLSLDAADQLLQPSEYISSVLGEGP